MLAIIAFLLVGFALRQTYAVTMPLAAAAVVIAAVWPVKPWLERYFPPTLSNLGTVLVLFAVLAAFAGAISFSVARVAQAFTENSDKLQQLYQSLSDWVRSWGGSIGSAGNFSRVIGMAEKALGSAYNIIVYIGIIGILVVFGLPEVGRIRHKIDRQTDGKRSRELVDAAELIAVKVRQYLWVTTITSAITGAATLVLSLVLGLDLALVWALLNFLLNYIPIVGNFVGIVPPTLYAVIQFGGWAMPAVVFGGFSLVQIVISNFVAPTLQGKSLSLTPMAVILALSVWSWIWGVAGALIAVPLTSAAVVLCNHFPSVQWIAALLEDKDDQSPDARHDTQQTGSRLPD
ncbi:AI-2E family transporter [Methylocystis echinoides]|uniref:AI-2E family transporter n=1 Tax=Methylocystis echinoides TaxID=29468 RepID=UPI003425C6FF